VHFSGHFVFDVNEDRCVIEMTNRYFEVDIECTSKFPGQKQLCDIIQARMGDANRNQFIFESIVRAFLGGTGDSVSLQFQQMPKLLKVS
jgi:hypothetical protein